MHVVSYKGVSLSSNGFWAGIPDEDAKALWSAIPSIAPRRNEKGEITAVTISERPIPTQIGYTGALTFEQAFFLLVGDLNPLDTTPGELVVQLNDPDDNSDPIVLSCNAIVTNAGKATDDNDRNVVAVTFLATDPLWRSTTAITETSGTIAYNSYSGLNDVTVEGMAPVHGQVRLTPKATGGNTQARSFTITNNGARTMRNFPVRVTVGDAYSDITVPVDRWFAILVDGVQQRAEFIRNQDQLFYVWFVVPYLAPGQSVDCMIIKNSAGLPEWGFNSYTQPAFNYKWMIVSAVSGNTTSADFGSPAWETDMWDDGVIEWLDGPNAGQVRRITSNDDDQVFWTTALPNAVASGHTALIRMSDNGYWTWRVQQTERNTNQRGLWWINQGQKKPSEARYDVPGAWKPELFLHNNDVMNQAEWTPSKLNDIGSSADYFAILDVDYSWTNATTFKEGLRANGVAIQMPFEIVSLKLNEQFKNPNGMCRWIVGSRTAGTGGWIEEYARTDASDTLTLYNSDHTVTLSDESYQVFLGVVPRNDANDAPLAELGEGWASDDGTATSGTSTQLNDNTKTWLSDQWIGAQLRIVSGTGAGQNVPVTDSGPNFLNATFTTAPDSTSRYRLKQGKLIATARTNNLLSMSWDTSNLVISALSAWENVYLVDRVLYVDRDTAVAAPPYQYLDPRPDTTGRHLVLKSTETLVIGGEEMQAWIEDGSGNVVRIAPPKALVVRDVEADGTERLAERWLWLTPGTHDLKLGTSDEHNAFTVALTYAPSYFG